MNDNSKMMKAMLLGGIAAFVFVFLFEFAVHGFLMAGMYEATMSVWRPQAESSMIVMLLSQFLFAMAVAFFYPIIGFDKECKKAIPFGFGLGLVMAMPQNRNLLVQFTQQKIKSQALLLLGLSDARLITFAHGL